MKPNRKSYLFSLPHRKEHQRLPGFVSEHLKEIERAFNAGIPYKALLQAVRNAGFATGTEMSLRGIVCKARKRARECTPPQTFQINVPAVTSEASTIRDESSLPPSDDSGAAIAKRLRRVTRPPRKGEPDPLD